MADIQGAMSVLLSALPNDVASALIAGQPVPASLLPTAAPSLSPADSAKVQSAVGVVLSALPGSAASSLVSNYGSAQTVTAGSTATNVQTATDTRISAATATREGTATVTGEQTSAPAATDTQPGGTITASTTSSTQTGPAALASGAAAAGASTGGSRLAGGQVAGVAVGSAAAGIFLIALIVFFWRRRSKKSWAGGKRRSGEKVFPEVAWLYDPKRTPSGNSRNAPEVNAPLMSGANTAYQPHPISGPGTSYQPTPAMSGAATPNHFYPTAAGTAAGTAAASSISSWRPGTHRSFEQQYQPINQPYGYGGYGATDDHSAAPAPSVPGGHNTARSLTASSKGTYLAIPPLPTLSSAPDSDNDHSDDEDESPDDPYRYHDASSSLDLPGLLAPSGPFIQPQAPPSASTSQAPFLANPFADPAPEAWEFGSATLGQVVSLHNRQPSSDYGTPLMTIREEGASGSPIQPRNPRSPYPRGAIRSTQNLHPTRSELSGTEIDRAELSGEGSSSAGTGGGGISDVSASGASGGSPGTRSGGNSNDPSPGISNESPNHGQEVAGSDAQVQASNVVRAGGEDRGRAEEVREAGQRGEVERNGSYGFGNANLSPISGRSLR